jgi:hypothetical protein
MDQLLEKLAISKAIMDKHNQIKRGQLPSQDIDITKPELQEFSSPIANYNIPKELMSESNIPQQQKNNTQPTEDLIMKSKLIF